MALGRAWASAPIVGVAGLLLSDARREAFGLPSGSLRL